MTWLKKHLKTEATATEVAEMLNRIGLEVAAIEETGPEFSGVVVGHIITRTQHPEADKLGVCSVDVGESEPVQIVCGAPNARDNLKVAVAKVGAVLPGDFKIKKSKLRGETSNGMICSVRELGLGTEHEGIWELETDAPLGTDLKDAIEIDSETVIEIEVTPNRGDALSVYGIARDLAAAGLGELITDTSEITSETADFDIAHEGCSYLAIASLKNIENKQTPEWMKSQLEAVGLRSINPLADITNYVMMDLGQPMHAYDASKVSGALKVTSATAGEKLEGLNDETYTLSSEDMVIADDTGTVGLAGIVGGVSTSADETTTTALLEAATFNKVRIAKSGQRLQAITDSRYRFERGVDAKLPRIALKKAIELAQEICGAEVVSVQEKQASATEVLQLDFELSFLKSFGGVDMPKQEVVDSLTKLGFKVEDKGDVLGLTVPTHYHIFDGGSQDVVEEILRLKGYDAIPAILPEMIPVNALDDADYFHADRGGRRALASAGYLEAINYSFIPQKHAQAFGGGQDSLRITNPITSEMSDMRPSLLPGLLMAVKKNVARSESHIRLAEVGHIYTDKGQTLKAAAVRFGGFKHWQAGSVKEDLFALKADAIALLESFGHDATKLQTDDKAPEWFHPGRSGSIGLGPKRFVYFGELHPAVAKSFGLKGRVYIFEADLDAMSAIKVKPKKFELSQYQAVNRDFAFLVAEDVPAEKLLQTLRGADKELVKEASLFDVYQGEGVPAGFKSVAMSLTLQAMDRTLTDDEINKVSDKVVADMSKRYEAELRS